MFVIRWVLGRIILLLDWVFQPKRLHREPEAQAKVDQATARLSLYQYRACPFCVKVRRAMKRRALNIVTCDAKGSSIHAEHLVKGGGQLKVPCLRIQEGEKDTWLYESNEIIRYLEERFSDAGTA